MSERLFNYQFKTMADKRATGYFKIGRGWATLVLCCVLATGYAQEASTASGGDATGTGGTVAYSIGQVVYTALNGPSGSVNQGVQQSYEIYSVGIGTAPTNISMSVFPNPTTNNLTLKVEGIRDNTQTFRLTDIQGNLVYQGTTMGTLTQINTSSLASGAYLLIVTGRGKEVQTFKIIKSK